MAVESTSGIWSLDPTLPQSSDDISEGDDHIRAIKSMVSRTFPNISSTVNATAQELNYLSGATSDIQPQLDALSASLASALTIIQTGAYGGLSISAGASPDFSASTSLAAFILWDAGMATTGVTVNTANGSLSPDVDGVYEAVINFSFSGTASAHYNVGLFVDDVATNIRFAHRLNANAELVSAQASGLISCAAGVVIKTRVEGDAADVSFEPKYGQFYINRIPSD